jgi:FkbM family methyltransferase
MSTKEKVLHNMTRSDFVRRTYGVCRSIPVLGVGFQKLVHAAMPLGTRLWVQIPEGLGKGLWMYADLRFELGYTNGDHEPWLQDLLQSELRAGDCYYDVGAHSGFFSLIAARRVGPSGAVLAFEPDPQNAAILKVNIGRNHLAQIAVLEAAVWSSPGEVTFEQASEASNRTQGRVSANGDTRSARISVPAVRLDDLVFNEGRPKPDLIKMDVEGAEWEALQGARRLLSELQPKLLCEVHDAAQMGQIRAYLEQCGYRAEEWKPVHPHYDDYRQIYLWAVPRERAVR